MYQEVLNFWFEELTPKMWWQQESALDNRIRKRFAALHQQARQGELYAWRSIARGALAEIIVLDQFSRNIYRDTPQAFENDAVALVLAQEAVAKGVDRQLAKVERSFLYMPYMHSESALIHEEALKLFTELGEPGNLDFERKHKAIIDRFGRYPHRNRILGRPSTPEELAFLRQPNSGF